MMIMNVTRLLSLGALLVLANLGLASDLRAGECSPMLQAAEVARTNFSSKLKMSPVETEFDKFVGNIDNYSVGLSDDGAAYVVVFKLMSKGRGVIAGGGAVYRVRKSDLAILDFKGRE